MSTIAMSACIALGADSAFAQTSGKIPQLTSDPSDWAWVRIRADGRNALFGDGWLDPPPGLRGPIRNDPDHPLRGNADRATGQVTLAMGNYRDPILKPWAAEQMRISNEEVLTGKRGMPFLATSRCYPGGVPGQLLWTTERLFFIQEPKVVHMVWERDSLLRRIYMTDKHSEEVKPSWFGESIGHYEGGDTLVIDTIGLQARDSYLDWFRTPHTEKLHVNERLRLSADGSALEALVRVEDPDTFNEPLNMVRLWRKVPNPLYEMVCGENNRDYFGLNLFPVTQADTPDF
jgi:hypothetical protein